jgi:hypothetical protein
MVKRLGSHRFEDKEIAMMKRWLPAVVMVAVAAAGWAVIAPSAAQATTRSCAVTWGSLEKSSGGYEGAPTSIVNVRGGRHVCFDRLVIDYASGRAGYHVRYVPAVLTQAKGDALRLRGGAFLEIVVEAGTNNIDTGASTYNPANPNSLVNVTGWRTFRQVAFGGSFEGYTTIGLGVRARLPFRVFTLDNPGRLVIDVAPHW